MAEAKGSTAYAAKHQHGVQVKETGVADVPVSEARVAALEERIAHLEGVVKGFDLRFASLEPKKEALKKDKAA